MTSASGPARNVAGALLEEPTHLGPLQAEHRRPHGDVDREHERGCRRVKDVSTSASSVLASLATIISLASASGSLECCSRKRRTTPASHRYRSPSSIFSSAAPHEASRAGTV